MVDEFELPGGTGPIAINHKTNLVYVTNPFSDTITVLDGSTNNLQSTIKIVTEKTKIPNKSITN